MFLSGRQNARIMDNVNKQGCENTGHTISDAYRLKEKKEKEYEE